jgi:hypothetical protein
VGDENTTLFGGDRKYVTIVDPVQLLNETSHRLLPLNAPAKTAVERMLARADALGHTNPTHYLWPANQWHQFDPTQPAKKWDTAWRALRDAAGFLVYGFTIS